MPSEHMHPAPPLEGNLLPWAGMSNRDGIAERLHCSLWSLHSNSVSSNFFDGRDAISADVHFMKHLLFIMGYNRQEG